MDCATSLFIVWCPQQSLGAWLISNLLCCVGYTKSSKKNKYHFRSDRGSSAPKSWDVSSLSIFELSGSQISSTSILCIKLPNCNKICWLKSVNRSKVLLHSENQVWARAHLCFRTLRSRWKIADAWCRCLSWWKESQSKPTSTPPSPRWTTDLESKLLTISELTSHSISPQQLQTWIITNPHTRLRPSQIITKFIHSIHRNHQCSHRPIKSILNLYYKLAWFAKIVLTWNNVVAYLNINSQGSLYFLVVNFHLVIFALNISKF